MSKLEEILYKALCLSKFVSIISCINLITRKAFKVGQICLQDSGGSVAYSRRVCGTRLSVHTRYDSRKFTFTNAHLTR